MTDKKLELKGKTLADKRKSLVDLLVRGKIGGAIR